MYGIHYEDNVAYLVQKQNVQNAVGLKKIPAFYELRRNKCPHNIDVDQPDPSSEFMRALPEDYGTDPLIKALMPLPCDTVDTPFFVESYELLDLVTYASNMLSATSTIIHRAGGLNDSKIKNDLYRSNLMTYVINGVDNSRTMLELSKTAAMSPSKIILLGDDMVPIPFGSSINRETTRVKLTNELKSPQNWQRLGAMLLRKYMRT